MLLERRRAVLAQSSVAAPITFGQLSPNAGRSWFSEPQVIVAAGQLISGFVRANGDIAVSSLNLTTHAYSEFTLHAALEIDDHDNPTFVVRPDGKLIAFYDKHNDNSGVRYRICTDPANISNPASWGAEQFILDGSGGGIGMAYDNELYLGTRLFVFARDGQFLPSVAWSDDDGATWNTFKTLFQAIAAQRPYVKYAKVGTKLHLLASAGHPRDVAAGAGSIYHFYYDHADASWHKSDGTLIRTMAAVVGGSTMIASDVTLVNDAAVTGNGWPMSLEIDGSGNPVGTIMYSSAASDDNRYAYVRWTGSAWVKTEMLAGQSSVYGPGAVAEPQYAGTAVVDPRDTTRVWVSEQIAGQWEIRKWVTGDNGATWAKTAITTASAKKNFRPYVPRNWVAGAPDVVWTYGDYTGFNVAWSTELRASPAPVIIALPANTVAPAITGNQWTGQTVTCSTGTWTGTPSGYAYQWKRNGTNISGATSSTYVLQAADEGTSVKCTVTASNTAGSVSADSNTISPVAAPTAPGQVTGLGGTPGNAQVALSWSAPANGGSPITDYLVEYRTSPAGSWTTFSHTASAATSRTVTGLSNGTAYDFRVSAVNAIGTGTASATVTSTPSSSTVVVNDTFTGADATAITAHTPDTGTSWGVTQNNTTTATIQGNQLQPGSGAGQSSAIAAPAPSSADHSAAVDVVVKSTAGRGGGPIIRATDPPTETYYWARWNLGSAAWQLFKVVAGTATQLGSNAADTPSAAQVKRAKLTAVGSTITLYVDGVQTIQVTDTAITANGKCGFRANDGGTNIGAYFDNLQVTVP